MTARIHGSVAPKHAPGKADLEDSWLPLMTVVCLFVYLVALGLILESSALPSHVFPELGRNSAASADADLVEKKTSLYKNPSNFRIFSLCLSLQLRFGCQSAETKTKDQNLVGLKIQRLRENWHSQGGPRFT